MTDSLPHPEVGGSGVPATPSGSGLNRRFRLRNLAPSYVVFWASFGITCAAAFIRQRVLFRVHEYPYGDAAVNSFLVVRAEHFQQLTGNYSRVGFYHPGPALLYMLAFGERLFHDVLHVAPEPYNGQLLGVSVYVSVLAAFAMVSIYRTTGSRGATAIAFGILFFFLANQGLFGTDWFPYLYVAPFLLFAVAAGALCAGRTSELPLYVLSCGLLVHGHVSFLLFVVVTTIVVGFSWWLHHRGVTSREVAAHRRGLWASAVLLFIIVLPIVVDICLHYPGQWGKYWLYANHQERAPRSAKDVISLVWSYWKALGIPLLLFVLAIVVGVVLTATERFVSRRRLFSAFYAVLVLQTFLVTYYIWRGVDQIKPRASYDYVGLFYEMVPALVLALAAAQLWIRLSEIATTRMHLAGWARAIPVITLSGLLVIAASATSKLGDLFEPYADPTAVVSQLAQSPERGDRQIAFVQDQLMAWPQTAAIAAQLQRDDVTWCLNQPESPWPLLYTAAHICSGTAPRWVVHATLESAPPGTRVLWKGSVVENQPPLTLYT